jgi:hypothetical protein
LAGVTATFAGVGPPGAVATDAGAPVRAPTRVRLQAGISIVVPSGWHVALRLTGLAEPFERFTLASFPLHPPPRIDASCGPTQAVATMPADGALAFLFEYPTTGVSSRQSFPPQPNHFALPAGPSQPYECFGQGWMLHFRAAGRPFQVMIALGPHAGANRGLLLRALSSLHVDADRAPSSLHVDADRARG